MKKSVRILLCLSLCLSFVFAFGCNTKELMFNGNYDIEATDEDIAELVADVDTDDLLGEENVIGASVTLKYDIGNATQYTYGGETESASSTLSGELEAKVSVDQEKFSDEDTRKESIKMSLSLDVDSENENSYEEVNEKLSGSIGAYLDDSGLYLNLQTTTNNTEQTTKGRIDADEIMTLLSQILGGSSITSPSFDVDSDDLEDAFEYLQEIGCKVYIDNSNGHKIKISVTEEALINVFEDTYGSSYYDIDYNFDIETADFYIAIDKNGVLKGIKIDIDVEYAINQESYYGATYSTEGSIKLELSAFMGAVKINTPSNLDTFEDMDIEDLEEFLG